MTDNVEMAQRAWGALNRKDFDEAMQYIHPDVEWRPALGPGGFEGRVIRGSEEYGTWLRDELFEVWADFRGEHLEFFELAGDRVLLLGELVARGRASGVETRTPFGQIGEWRDGLVFRQTAYPSHSAALAAAGIDLPDVVRRALEAFNSQDLSAVRELSDEQFEWRPAMAAGVEGRTYVGIEGVERYFAELRETWDEMWIIPGDVHEWRKGFVLSVTAHVRGHASGVALAQPATAVFTLREGRIRAVEMFVDPAAAAEATAP